MENHENHESFLAYYNIPVHSYVEIFYLSGLFDKSSHMGRSLMKLKMNANVTKLNECTEISDGNSHTVDVPKGAGFRLQAR